MHSQSDKFYYQMKQQSQQDETNKKIERITLQLNKTGLSYLTNGRFAQAIQFFRKAQKIMLTQLRIDPKNIQMNKLAGITYNNLACYYKKTHKPKVALSYLKKALDLQVYKVQDWTSTASTHLNICAIYSFLNQHQNAAHHAQLAINLLSKVQGKQLSEESEQYRSFLNVIMLSYYNLAVELEHLKYYDQSLKAYKEAQNYGKKGGKKNTAIIITCQQSINRLTEKSRDQLKKMSEILKKRRQAEEKGYQEFMRKNIKNYGRKIDVDLEQRLKKFLIYRETTKENKMYLYTDPNEQRRNYASVDRIKKLQPITQTKFQRSVTQF